MVAVITPEPQSLADAAMALDRGMAIAAGVMVRAALEGHLRSLCIAYGYVRKKPRPPAAMDLIYLYRKKHFDQPAFAQMRRAIKIGNYCAHGHDVPANQVEWMVNVVRTFMMSHPLPEWHEETFPAAG